MNRRNCTQNRVEMRIIADVYLIKALQWRHIRSCHLKSPAARVFVRQFVQANIKRNIKALHDCPFWGETTGGSPSKVKRFHAKTSHGITNKLDINTLRPRRNGRHFTDDILIFVFLISLKLMLRNPIDDRSAMVQVVAWRRTGDMPLSEAMNRRQATI